MTIRDIMVSFGFAVDSSSERNAENSIRGLKGLATKLLGGIAVVFSVAKLKGFADDCVKAASSVQEMQNKFDVVFDGMTDEVEKWADDFSKAVGRNKNTIKTYLADQQNLLVGFGMTRQEGAKLSQEMTSLALDIASFSNIDEDMAVRNMSKAIMGESESAKMLGAVLNDVTRAETMRKMGLSGSYNKLDQLTKMQVNYNAILSQSRDAIGDCERSINSYEARQRQLNAAKMEFKEFVGGQLLPVFAEFTKWMTMGVRSATKFAEAILLDADGNNRLLKTFERIRAVVKKLQPAMERFANSIRNGIRRATDTVKDIAEKLGGMDNLLKILAITAGAFFLVMKFNKIISGARAFVFLLKKAWTILGGIQLKALGVVAVVVLLALIIEDFFQFLKGNDSVIGSIFDKAGIGADNARQAILKTWNKVRDFLLGIWDFLKQAGEIWTNSVNELFGKHSESVRQNFERAWGLIKSFLYGVWTFISQIAETLFGKTEDDIEGSTTSTKDKLLSIWQSVLDTLSSIFSALYEVASAVFNAIATVVEVVFGLIKSFWDNWGDEVLSSFKVLWDNMGTMISGFLDVITGLANFVSSVLKGDWQGAWEAIQMIFEGVWTAISAFLSSVLETIKLGITVALGAIQTVFMSIFTAIFNFVSSIFSGMFNAITTTIGNIKTTIVDGFNAAIEYIKALPAQAVQWGSDMVNGIVQGIRNSIGNVIGAVKDVAGSIRSFLHFSVPDEGPLTDYESWMPDFMQGLAKGIRGNEGLVLDRVKGLANSISTLVNSATAQSITATRGAVNNKTSNVTQNVNISNSYSGGSAETQKNVSKAMKKSAVDATTQMARSLAYSRG